MWKKIMPILNAIGYKGPLTLEIDYKSILGMESYIRHSYFALECLRKLIGGASE